MEVLALPRRCGKTTSLIRRCHHLEGILVCSNRRNEQQVLKDAAELGIKIQTSTFQKLFHGDLKGKKRPLLIDNAEFAFERFGNVRAISVTPELRPES